MRVEAELLHDRHDVGGDPFAVDPVLVDHAVGDGARHEGPPGRRAVAAVLGVPPRPGDQMRGVEPVPVVARPDHLRRHAAAFGQRDQPLDGVAHHLLAVVHGLGRGIDHAIVGVVGIDQPDIALVPDPMRAADDVVDDIGVDRIEAPHRLHASRSVGTRSTKSRRSTCRTVPDAFSSGAGISVPVCRVMMSEDFIRIPDKADV